MTTETISCTPVPARERCDYTDRLFGMHFPMQLEPYIYSVASGLSTDYRGGYWEFFELGNGGFYVAPDADEPFAVSCSNGYEGKLTADAFGITAFLHAYSRTVALTTAAVLPNNFRIAEPDGRRSHLTAQMLTSPSIGRFLDKRAPSGSRTAVRRP